ncbi:MAG: hypothetical protein VX736_03865 [Candidatus Neomarinimicrobiota bacterium]|nr:hypothetical protein [Candidatus Neomarinimicrobiota bacterium]
MSDIKNIVKHIFSKKSLSIRAFTFVWVLGCSWFWVGDPIRSIGLSVSVLIGSMIIQGVLEWFHE